MLSLHPHTRSQSISIINDFPHYHQQQQIQIAASLEPPPGVTISKHGRSWSAHSFGTFPSQHDQTHVESLRWGINGIFQPGHSGTSSEVGSQSPSLEIQNIFNQQLQHQQEQNLLIDIRPDTTELHQEPPSSISTTNPIEINFTDDVGDGSYQDHKMSYYPQPHQQHRRHTSSSAGRRTPSTNPSTPASALDSHSFPYHTPQTTLVLGMLSHLDRLEREVADMREFVRMGFRELNSPGQYDVEIENMRLQARNWNRANVTELDEQFQILPLMPGGDIPSDVPRTGEVLRRAPHKVMDHILDLYEIPFVPTMFLGEKKMLYLRFLGAGRVVMHRILD